MAAAGGGGPVQYPVVGQCYEYTRTRNEEFGYGARGEERKSFVLGEAIYLGECRDRRTSRGPGGLITVYTFFDGAKEFHILVQTGPQDGFFVQVPCAHSNQLNQNIQHVYTEKTGQSALPGVGPANIIRKMMGVGAKSVGFMAGGRRKNTRRTRRKSKKTRSRSRK
jgi:hypothetical protein